MATILYTARLHVRPPGVSLCPWPQSRTESRTYEPTVSVGGRALNDAHKIEGSEGREHTSICHMHVSVGLV